MVIAKRLSDEDTEEDIREAFSVFDKDGNGYITHKDLQTVLTKLGLDMAVDEIEDMITEADNDGNGKVSIEDLFKEILAEENLDLRKSQVEMAPGVYAVVYFMLFLVYVHSWN
ncbi:calmodulin-like [Ylistrum balloti]|uniref:calmodulin-like n=1 Tax=Ylistrum balloti TaxID=509963 RepID=UPI002905CB71|nr:calmodulin-like [Ylistrum balloti]